MLLAKPDESLLEHTENALKVFASLKEAYPEIPDLCNVPQFRDNLFYAVFLHDFGKGAKGFQEELKTGKRWNYRHEILSAGFVSSLELSEDDKRAIGLAVITHHKDIQELREKYATYPEDNPGFKRYKEKIRELDLAQLNNILDYIPEFSKKYLGKKLSNYHYINNCDDLMNVYKEYVLPYYKEYRLEEFSPLHRKYGIFMKGFLTASDHLASAGIEEIKRAVDIDNYIQFEDPTSVQNKAKNHKGDLFIISPTGSGKTEAALFWANHNQNYIRAKRTFYILPYTASINYMYKRFVKLLGSDELVAVLHGKSSYFLYKYFSESSEDIPYDKAKDYAKKCQSFAKKIFKPYKILTPFQIIKAFFNLKGFERNISEMAGGLFIFDEIHSYDPHTTALILQTAKFIKNELNGNFLLMTATMPSFLERYFMKELNINSEIRMGNQELEEFTRHRIKILEGSIEDHIPLIKKDIEVGKKVLVAVNTVKQAQDVYQKLKDINPNSALLHSRFILRDREKIESSLSDKNLLVGTQVIEVSLNIDYDVLYTESAPIDALLQRFGRVNRRGEKCIAPVYIFTRGTGIGLVYSKVRTSDSIEVFKNIEILNESKIQSLIDDVYKNGYSEEEQRVLKEVSENFQSFYRSNVPFIDSNKEEDNFYSLFKSVEVLPLCFYDEYMNEIENKRFYEAMKYILPISLNQYMYLLKNDRISKTDNGVVVDAVYDNELGLLIDKQSSALSI